MGNLFGGGGSGPRNTSTTNYTTTTQIRDIGLSGEAANQLASTLVQGATALSANALSSNLQTQELQIANTNQVAGLLGAVTTKAVDALAQTKETSGLDSRTLLLIGLAVVGVIIIARK